jgi:dTDP-4-amino-4,6-dideoxygalactose transaminase
MKHGLADRIDAPPSAARTMTQRHAQFPAPHLRWPQHESDEIDAVRSVLASGRVNSLVHGDECRAFELEFAAYCEAPFAISLANGTVALELALRALDIGSGDEVIVPARSFFATASAVVAAGAIPVFADIELNSHTIDPRSVQRLVNGRTRAILCVHLAGWPCAMDELDAVARRHGLWLIEDCAQAHGARYNGRPVGSFGDAAAFSFCTDKIMSTGGEGGMILLKDENHWARAWSYKDHGKDPYKLREPMLDHSFRYVHDSFGSNMRLTEMQAAIGRVQLRKLPGWLAQRRNNAATLLARLAGHPLIRLPSIPAHVEHAFYKFYLTLESDAAPLRDQLLAELNGQGIPAGTGSCPDMSREAAIWKACLRDRQILPVADLIGDRSVMLPVDHLLTAGEMELVADALLAALEPARSSLSWRT